MIQTIYNAGELTERARELFREERQIKRLDGWFLARDSVYRNRERFHDLPRELKAALELREIIRDIPISISNHAIFAGTQRDAFARTYALINPKFEVESFSGYCDPTAIFNDIEPEGEITRERIDAVCEYTRQTDYVKTLTEVYEGVEEYTSEVAFFIEQVTGHLIPDFKVVLAEGIDFVIEKIDRKLALETDETRITNYTAMKFSLENVILLAERYAKIADEKRREAVSPSDTDLFELMSKTLARVPRKGATNLYEAIQSYILLWQTMCLEQAPNPFAFSVGNADRIFEPFRAKENTDREYSAGLLKHFLVFFNVGDRSWAISQNLLIGGKSGIGKDMTNDTSYALLDAYYEMNLPQPILSVKLHKGTPERLYGELGRFFFTPGTLTPSLFNDDSVFEVLKQSGVGQNDLEDYSVAGCQEPLIMGKDNGNTTNSWLNLAKILELTINGGFSTITGKKIGNLEKAAPTEIFTGLRDRFYENVNYYTDKMITAANGASLAVSYLPVPFLSAFMGGIETGYDVRDIQHQGTRYNGSGCLIHGLSIVADSFLAVDCFLKDRPQDCERLLEALKTNFKFDKELQKYLLSCPKFGNNIESVDREAAQVATRISDMIASKRNDLGNPFRPDWSSPTTHLLYGYWTGATPDGRSAREMLGYGVDPLYGEASQGMGFRMLSAMNLPYKKMSGGYASHFGIDPKYFKADTVEGKGLEFYDRIIKPLFFNPENENFSPFYIYVNVTTPDILRKVLANPAKYAPSGVYIMRIHGTFVNFLDLSPAIQQDIIKRLDPASTSGC